MCSVPNPMNDSLEHLSVLHWNSVHVLFFPPPKILRLSGPGTLVDQLTYPELGDSSRVSKDELKDVLQQVDLDYLVERPDVLTTEINWEEHCSLGEKQRLAIARLIWHRPEYAILGASDSTSN